MPIQFNKEIEVDSAFQSFWVEKKLEQNVGVLQQGFFYGFANAP